MALIVEDGTGKVDSQTYVDAAEARAFALARGVALPAAPGGGDPDPVEALLMSAMDYIESKENRMKGKRTNANKTATPTPFLQALSFPRRCMMIACEEYPIDKIPANLAAAQNQLVIAQFQGAVLMPVLDPNKQLVKRKKVDVIEKEFFGPGEAGVPFGTSPVFPVVDALLQPLMRPGGASAPAYRA